MWNIHHCIALGKFVSDDSKNLNSSWKWLFSPFFIILWRLNSCVSGFMLFLPVQYSVKYCSVTFSFTFFKSQFFSLPCYWAGEDDSVVKHLPNKHEIGSLDLQKPLYMQNRHGAPPLMPASESRDRAELQSKLLGKINYICELWV